MWAKSPFIIWLPLLLFLLEEKIVLSGGENSPSFSASSVLDLTKLKSLDNPLSSGIANGPGQLAIYLALKS